MLTGQLILEVVEQNPESQFPAWYVRVKPFSKFHGEGSMSPPTIAIGMSIARIGVIFVVLMLTNVDCRAQEVVDPVGTIAFSSVAPRGWDLYVADLETGKHRQLTDHPALDYNAAVSPDGLQYAFVSEREGNPELYLSGLKDKTLSRLTREFAMNDHPTWSPDGRQVAFVSTRRTYDSTESADRLGLAWNAVYVMNLDGSELRRLTPPNIADYSPAWSPCGRWIAVASGSGRTGGTDLYLMRIDGTERRLVVNNGGWPAFGPDGETLYFHSRRQNQWSVWQIQLDGSNLLRVTPAGVNAYTPRASSDGHHLVLTVDRGNHRQVAIVNSDNRELRDVTSEPIDHWNPTISADGRFVVYHRRTESYAPAEVETWSAPPGTSLRLLRVTGSFPALSPDGSQVALVGSGFGSLDLMNIDGTTRRTIYQGTGRGVFSVSWAKGGEDWIAFSVGRAFQGPSSRVDVAVIKPDGSNLVNLTEAVGNNAFPSFSPDGQQLVFRSGRDGSKNLYVMQRDGTEVRRLTEGNWTDTMCHWSPSGEWITFASDRDGNFDIWLIRSDASETRKLIGGGGRNNHPHFSPCGQWIVFTSQRAGYSAEEISLPRQPQPYGSLFMVRIDGSNLTRLTHNGFEEGTPDWGN